MADVTMSDTEADDLELIEGEEEEQDEEALLTLERAVSAYFVQVGDKINQQERVAVTRFVSWYGPSRAVQAITAHELSLFQEAVGDNAADLAQRLLPVKGFFAHAKKRQWTGTNLGVHLRVKKAALQKHDETKSAADEEMYQMTPDGLAAAQAELERLKEQRPKIQRDLASAMADKDFRENAPLDAARDAQAMLEARIREVEHQIGHAVIVVPTPEAEGGKVHLGSHVGLLNLEAQKPVAYTLVSQNEVDAVAGRISIASPVGQALVGRSVGDEVDVVVPSGTVRFRVQSIEG